MPTAQSTQPVDLQKITIRAKDKTWNLHWDELWRHRELLYFLTWRDIKVRYKQTVLGVAWAILPPLAIALALAVFLGRMIHLPSDNLPYPVFVYSGMVLWQLFAHGLTESSNSISRNEQLVSKVYFPRLFAPLSSIAASLLDFAISVPVLFLFLLRFHVAPTIALALIPLFVLPVVLSSLGAGLWLSALNVKFRDVHHIVSFLVQFWFFATPVAYPISSVPTRWRLLYELNPMVGTLQGFRWALHGEGAFPARSVILAISASTALLLTGLYYFRRTEDTFADFI